MASSIDTARVSSLLRTPAQRSTRAKLLPVLSNVPELSTKDLGYNSHAQNLLRGLKASKALLELRDKHNWTDTEFATAVVMQNENLGAQLHENAFIAVIDSQGDEEQRRHWLPRCRRYEVVGCYAQTELAHGSDVQGLETVAKYDPKTQEFVIHSPRLESMKWWIGGLGVLANHALVQAILEIPKLGADAYVPLGPHLFIVPIRSLDTHLPLPGVHVGDIGPKSYSGFRQVDNGFLRLSHIRIPLRNMLSRFSKLSPDGTYSPPSHSKLSYGSMVYLRAGIPSSQGWALARAVTIALRYCSQRKQFSSPEAPVITYASTRHRLFPLLATAYAYIFASQQLWLDYESMLSALRGANDASKLPEVHVLSTALKVKATWDCVAGLEEARKTVGGHGYSHLSGIGTLFAQFTPAQTFEGDNYVISQQTAKALVKAYVFGNEQVVPRGWRYLFYAQGMIIGDDWSEPRTQLRALEIRAKKLVADLAAKGPKADEWAMAHSFTTARVAAAHADVFVVSSFPRGKLLILDCLANLFALTILVKNIGELVDAGIDVKGLRAAQEEAVEQLKIGDALALADAFEFWDWELPGVLGEKDGGVYARMVEETEKCEVGKGEYGGELREAAREVVGYWRSGKRNGKVKL